MSFFKILHPSSAIIINKLTEQLELEIQPTHDIQIFYLGDMRILKKPTTEVPEDSVFGRSTTQIEYALETKQNYDGKNNNDFVNDFQPLLVSDSGTLDTLAQSSSSSKMKRNPRGFNSSIDGTSKVLTPSRTPRIKSGKKSSSNRSIRIRSLFRSGSAKKEKGDRGKLYSHHKINSTDGIIPHLILSADTEDESDPGELHFRNEEVTFLDRLIMAEESTSSGAISLQKPIEKNHNENDKLVVKERSGLILQENDAPVAKQDVYGKTMSSHVQSKAHKVTSSAILRAEDSVTGGSKNSSEIEKCIVAMNRDGYMFATSDDNAFVNDNSNFEHAEGYSRGSNKDTVNVLNELVAMERKSRGSNSSDDNDVENEGAIFDGEDYHAVISDLVSKRMKLEERINKLEEKFSTDSIDSEQEMTDLLMSLEGERKGKKPTSFDDDETVMTVKASNCSKRPKNTPKRNSNKNFAYKHATGNERTTGKTGNSVRFADNQLKSTMNVRFTHMVCNAIQNH